MTVLKCGSALVAIEAPEGMCHASTPDRLRRMFPPLGKHAGGRRKSNKPSEASYINIPDIRPARNWNL